jgi:prevent-host-death family protein
MAMKERLMGAGEFKQHCLAIIDEVATTHRPVTISKRGRPMARLVPLEGDLERERRILEHLRSGDGGMRVSEEEFLEPTSKIAGWNES